MKLTDFFAFAAEMGESLKPVIEEITKSNSEKFKEAYKHAITAFKQIATAALQGRHFVRDTANPDKLIFYIFEDAREMENFLRWNTNDTRLVVFESEDDELKRCFFDDFVKTGHDWLSPWRYKMVDGTPTVFFDRK